MQVGGLLTGGSAIALGFVSHGGTRKNRYRFRGPSLAA